MQQRERGRMRHCNVFIGPYQFKISTQETTAAVNGEVWLSTNALPSNLRKILTLEEDLKSKVSHNAILQLSHSLP